MAMVRAVLYEYSCTVARSAVRVQLGGLLDPISSTKEAQHGALQRNRHACACMETQESRTLVDMLLVQVMTSVCCESHQLSIASWNLEW